MTPDRRSFLTNAGLAALAVGTGALAAGCSGPGTSGARALSIPASSVPVGGALILEDANYVVTQPTEGDFRAFNKMCTHQGCPVSEVLDGDLHCTCHGARFSLSDGSVITGPATRPLRSAKAVLEGDQVQVSAS